ncbi:hypothetical protein [Bdellovibrio sp. HCB274]|uniref:hypothetical protein n=1 Tax=Bdellovibrio sp. HCB274 TaxID=3394361 RepID=UPI0039B5FD9C
MKLLTKSLVLMTSLFLTTTALAQNAQTTKAAKDESFSSKGIRVGIVKPTLRVSSKASSANQSFHFSDDLDDAWGLSLGYASLPVQALGWTTNVTYLDMQSEGNSAGIVRVDGNFAYAFTNFINIKGGVNISKPTVSNSNEYDPGIGFQGGFGIQLNKNFGIDLGYTEMNQSRTSGSYSVDIVESGFEISLNGTF